MVQLDRIRYSVEYLIEKTDDWIIYKPGLMTPFDTERGSALHVASSWFRRDFGLVGPRQYKGNDAAIAEIISSHEVWNKVISLVHQLENQGKNKIGFFWDVEYEWPVLCIDCAPSQVPSLVLGLTTAIKEVKNEYYKDHGLLLSFKGTVANITQVELD